MIKHTKTLKVRVRDTHVSLLNSMARSVNLVWNFVNELSQRSIKERGVFLSAYDMHPYPKGRVKSWGCKETATDSNGHTIKSREYRKLEQKLGIAQRAKNKHLYPRPCGRGFTAVLLSSLAPIKKSSYTVKTVQ